MIDFTNGIIKLNKGSIEKAQALVAPLLIENEIIIDAFQTIRDTVVFTNLRIISINIQGITGKKKDFSSLPYNKIQAFSIETSGVFDLDCELELYFSSLGKVIFEFSGNINVSQISKTIAQKALHASHA